MAKETNVVLEPVVRESKRPTAGHLFKVWLGIGLQSFGGGAATLYLIRQEVVERQRWLTEAEFSKYWAICQLAPGINLLGLTVLIGVHIAGAVGIVLCLIGLLLPSVTVTIGIAAGYATIRQQPLVQAALQGIIPATVGMGLLLSVKMLRPIMAESRREGRVSLLVIIGLLVGSIAVVAVWHPPLIAVLWVGGTIAALVTWLRLARKESAS